MADEPSKPVCGHWMPRAKTHCARPPHEGSAHRSRKAMDRYVKAAAQWNRENAERHREIVREHYQRNRESILASKRKKVEDNG